MKFLIPSSTAIITSSVGDDVAFSPSFTESVCARFCSAAAGIVSTGIIESDDGAGRSVISGPGSPRLDGCESFPESVERCSWCSRWADSSAGGAAIAITTGWEVKARFGIDDRRVPAADPTFEARPDDLVAGVEDLFESDPFLLLSSGVIITMEGLRSCEE